MTAIAQVLEPLLSAAVAEQPWPRDWLGLPDWSSDTLGPLKAALEAAPELAILDDSLQVVDSQMGVFTRQDLGWWLLDRTARTSTETALEDLVQWLKDDEFDAFQVAVLSGLRVEEPIELEEEITFMPATHIPVERIARSVVESRLSSGLSSSALVRAVRLRKVHVSQVSTEGSSIPDDHCLLWDHFDAAWLALTLATRRGPQRTGNMVVAADSVPSRGDIGWGFGSFRQPRLSPTMIPLEAEHARKTMMRLMDDERRNRLRIPIERLNLHFAEIDPVQSAIELRIAMEALLLPELSTHELKFRLAIRGALLLSDNPMERREIKSTLEAAYNAGSTAIHTGRMPKDPVKARTAIKEAGALMVKACLRVLDSEPDWDALLLGTVDE